MLDAWLSAWAKTDRDHLSKEITAWLPLHQHLADTAGIVLRLVDEWVSPQVVRRLATDLDTADGVRTIATWLAAVHDVGKISPAFVVQAPPLADAMRGYGLVARPELAQSRDRPRVRHEVVGQLAVREFLADRLGFEFTATAAQLACVVGAHHGVPPESSLQHFVSVQRSLVGDGSWEEARTAALWWATDLVGGPEVLKPYASVRLGRPTQALLASIVIMADWIASNAELFPLREVHTAFEPPVEPDPDLTAARVAHAWDELDMPARWRPRRFDDAGKAFAARFGRAPEDARPIQLAAAEAALAQETPGLVIVEAPMGEGKTEAAFLAAEALAARSGADGCFVALPTRATTDAMFRRVLAWMRTLPGLPSDVSVLLAHGTAALNDDYRGLLRAAHVRGVGEDGDQESGIAHHWLRGRKKGPLAQFVIGTVDQALFGALKSRHVMLRHLGLAGKVVVIDEVHAYDVYMSRYLDRMLHWLGAYATPVLLLSATLPAARRTELIQAYESGRGVSSSDVEDAPGYPVVLASGSPARPVPAARTPKAVTVERMADDLDTLVDTLRNALVDGGCAVVIRNTVGRVQETADRLVAEFGEDEVTITHSRFLACDRAALDTSLLQRFGPPGEGTERPERHVVVASQVVEQSVDVDFDLMITDLAPVDLVLQRMGRLHRHQRERTSRLEQPRCVIVGVEDWAAEPPRAVPGSRSVYGEHALLRAAALLIDRSSITLPTDIPSLVQATYGSDSLGPAGWQDAMRHAEALHTRDVERRRSRAADFLLGEVGRDRDTLDGWIRAGVGDPQDEPRQGSGQVRDGDESIEVLVVQRDRDNGILTPDWVPGGGVQIPRDSPVDNATARTIAACALRLPPAMSRMDPVGDGVIRALERNHFTSFDKQPLLDGRLVLVLDADRTADVCDGPAAFRLTYDLRRGLLHAPLDNAGLGRT
ncbi:CRISPR-associated helicase Cas3' [Pseudonocardia adelaidensis]|uniref:CRISPR-associated helicase/endonuclease Cas3 n=1 Tax=Pseudonocardia adelaidensis TaxID=648754 RepID=A0ABP9NJT7_9PSEU